MPDFVAKLHFQFIRTVFVNIKDQQLLGAIANDLPAQLAADAAAAARNQNDLVLYVAGDLV